MKSTVAKPIPRFTFPFYSPRTQNHEERRVYDRLELLEPELHDLMYSNTMMVCNRSKFDKTVIQCRVPDEVWSKIRGYLREMREPHPCALMMMEFCDSRPIISTFHDTYYCRFVRMPHLHRYLEKDEQGRIAPDAPMVLPKLFIMDVHEDNPTVEVMDIIRVCSETVIGERARRIVATDAFKQFVARHRKINIWRDHMTVGYNIRGELRQHLYHLPVHGYSFEFRLRLLLSFVPLFISVIVFLLTLLFFLLIVCRISIVLYVGVRDSHNPVPNLSLYNFYFVQ